MFKQIVVGVDENDGGRDAIALAKRLLARDGVLTLAYIFAGDPYVYRGASAAYEASERERALELLEGRGRNRACRRICAGVDPLRWVGGCTSFAR